MTLHGLTASRRYVLQGSGLLAGAGFELISYDARGHGESDPAPEGGNYGYESLCADLCAVIAATVGQAPVILVGHSMGAHTAAAYTLERRDAVSALILVGPAWIAPPADEDLRAWDALAEGLEQGGVEGFLAAYRSAGLPEAWRETLVEVARQRLELHAYPGAVAQALREVPRSSPLAGLDVLARITVPTLVVGSRDEADPGHPRAVAEAWAERIPGASLVGEEEGQSPLAWRGASLSRAIEAFLDG